MIFIGQQEGLIYGENYRLHTINDTDSESSYSWISIFYKNEDPKTIAVDTKDFVTKQEFRDIKLNKILNG